MINFQSKKYINNLFYIWKRNKWMLDPRNYFTSYDKTTIAKPIFLLGCQGDGLTLLSRMLRRNPQVISVTGNSNYWAGADEIQNVLEPLLSSEISGIRINAPFHTLLNPPRSWSYACDDLIANYRKTEKDYSDKNRKKIRNAIGMVIRYYRKKNENTRFVDKSQVFTIKMSFINELLRDSDPYFILVTRNPFASCYRAAMGKAGDMKRYSKFLSIDNRIKICIEHWLNSMNAVEEDKNKVEHFMSIRFEDLLAKPEKILKEICDFIHLDFSFDMIPQKHHKLPLGVRFQERWYPLRIDVNDSYLQQLPDKYEEWIFQKCGELANKFGYPRPKKTH